MPRLATEALYVQSPRFLLRQRPKFSSFEVQAHRGCRYCGNHGLYHVVLEKGARDGAKAATPFGPLCAMIASMTRRFSSFREDTKSSAAWDYGLRNFVGGCLVAKGFLAVPFFDHHLRCKPSGLRSLQQAPSGRFTTASLYSYQKLDNNDALVPAADNVCHIVIITGPFSCLGRFGARIYFSFCILVSVAGGTFSKGLFYLQRHVALS